MESSGDGDEPFVVPAGPVTDTTPLLATEETTIPFETTKPVIDDNGMKVIKFLRASL